MNITFVNPGFEKMIDSIMMFQTEGETPYWSDSLFHFFQKLNQDVFQTLDYNAKKQYILNEMKEIYQEQESLINEKVVKYNRHWRRYRPQIEEALSDAFQVDTHQLFNDLSAEISLNPVSPRFLKDQYFQVFYLNSERGALGISLLELRQKAHTELARLQPWDEWRMRGKTYCSSNLIPIQCVYEPNI